MSSAISFQIVKHAPSSSHDSSWKCSKLTRAAFDILKRHSALLRFFPGAFESFVKILAMMLKQALMDIVSDALGADLDEYKAISRVITSQILAIIQRQALVSPTLD